MTKLLIALLILGTAGCLRTREEVNEMETSKQVQTQVSQVQKTKADSENKVMALQDEIRQLNGRLDVLERRAEQATPATATGPTNTDVIEQMKIFEQNNAAMKMKIEELEQKLAVAQKAQVSASSEKISGEKVAVAAVSKEKDAKEMKDSKESKDSKGAYEEAEGAFNKKEWKTAILSYQNYRDANPKGKNYADATYKIGVSFQELKMKDEAKVFFEEVLQKFSKSPSARKAKFRLGQFK
jgi:TolA-binding protein